MIHNQQQVRPQCLQRGLKNITGPTHQPDLLLLTEQYTMTGYTHTVMDRKYWDCQDILVIPRSHSKASEFQSVYDIHTENRRQI